MYNSLDYVVSNHRNYSGHSYISFSKYQPVEVIYKSGLERITCEYSSCAGVERIVSEYSKPEMATVYMPNVYVPDDNYISRATNITYVKPDVFLNPFRPKSRFINSGDEVQELVEETFEKVTGKRLDNVTIKVCSISEMKEFHKNWCPGIMGFSVNFGIGNLVFVLQDTLERLLITIGHELGHVFTRSLPDKLNEEAKAFAFEFAWVQAIRENDIGNLAGSLRAGMPAINGLHDRAFSFVANVISGGMGAMQVHWDIVNGKIGCSNVESLL